MGHKPSGIRTLKKHGHSEIFTSQFHEEEIYGHKLIIQIHLQLTNYIET
jgi:hypothetical protein